MAEAVRVRAVFSGTVQGVGFRYTTRRLAAGAGAGGAGAVGEGAAGWVRNLADGTVELVAEGPREDLVQLVEAVEQAMAGYVTSTALEWSAAAGGLAGFEIRY